MIARRERDPPGRRKQIAEPAADVVTKIFERRQQMQERIDDRALARIAERHPARPPRRPGL
jgi:hypothetical protein